MKLFGYPIIYIVKLPWLDPVFFDYIDKGDRLIADESSVFFGFNDFALEVFGAIF